MNPLRTDVRLLSDMSQTQPNFEHWLTKAEAAQALGVAEKTIDRMAAVGQIQKQKRGSPGKPPMAVFHPDDIERERNARHKTPAPFILPTETTAVQRLSDLTVPHPPKSYGQGDRRMSDIWTPSELQFIGYLSIQEAMRFTGLPEKTIQRFAREGRVQKIGTRYRRKDLEAL